MPGNESTTRGCASAAKGDYVYGKGPIGPTDGYMTVDAIYNCRPTNKSPVYLFFAALLEGKNFVKPH